MPTVLIVTRSFPPLLDVGGKRPALFASFLPQEGWNPIVLTSPVPAGHPVDAGSCDEGVVYRSLRPAGLLHPHLRYTADPAPIRRSRPSPLPLGADALLLPHAAAQIVRICKAHDVDVILATSGPPAVLLYASVAAALLNIPFCADFRDPWTLNALQMQKPAWARAIDRAVERMLLPRAAHVTFASGACREAYAGRYPVLRSRMSTILTGFDARIAGRSRPREVTPRLVHLGNCFGLRTLAPVIRAIAMSGESATLENFGRLRAEDVALAAQLGVPLIYRTPVGRQELADELLSADGLVLIGYGDSLLHVPAKTYDYLPADAPILCFASPSSEIADIVTQTNRGHVLAPNDPETAAAAIRGCLRSRTDRYTALPGSLAHYDARDAARKLALILGDSVSRISGRNLPSSQERMMRNSAGRTYSLRRSESSQTE